MLWLSIMNKNSKYANSTRTKRLCHANLYGVRCGLHQGCDMWCGMVWGSMWKFGSQQLPNIWKPLSQRESVLNGRVHKSYCKIYELQRCFYCATISLLSLSLYIYLSIVYLHLQFRIFWRFAIYFFTQAAPHRPVPPPLLLQLECALNFISVHSTLTNYFDKYSGMCVCVWELIADCTQNAN